MAGNSFGEVFKLTTFGESHGGAIGGIIEGCPAGISIDKTFIQELLSKRKPGQSEITTQRKEDDEVELLSGIFEGKTLGSPIGFIIRNKDAQTEDYSHLKDTFRPSHADFTWETKYGLRDYRGGGRSSARETACRVAGGAIAMQLLSIYGIKINAWVSAVGPVAIPDNETFNIEAAYTNDVRCPHEPTATKMLQYILQLRNEGDSTGGIISCKIQNVPVGLGEPVFDKLHACLAKAMVSINTVKGFETGMGFKAATMKGSEHNDVFKMSNNKITTATNRSGGIQGGISNGNDIDFRIAFKPVATIMKTQESVDRSGNKITLEGKGRHDPCVVPRAVPIVEAMAALVIADYLLLNRLSKY
jgi:chorismate synthase